MVSVLVPLLMMTLSSSAEIIRPLQSEPFVVIAEKGKRSDARLPENLNLLPSNNNVAIETHEGRLYLAFRSAPTHFASARAKLVVLSSPNLGRTWDHEITLSLRKDLREPTLRSWNGHLYLYFAVLGTNPLKFEPQGMRRMERLGLGNWSEPQEASAANEMFWEMKARNGSLWLTGYHGAHYGGGDVEVFFRKSSDGITWTPSREGASDIVYAGGVSEVGFEFENSGDLWAVTRNEDGDATGWGSHLARARASELDDWIFPSRSSPKRYDSPRMFTYGGEIYMVARRDIGGPFDQHIRWLPFFAQKWLYLMEYSMRPKRTSLYAIDREHRGIRTLGDFPSAGDTAFPSIVQISENQFLVANYTSPTDSPWISWFDGQVSRRGTQIHLVMLTFPR